MQGLKKQTSKYRKLKAKKQFKASQQYLRKELRGLATNKYGGTQLTTFRGFRGQTYGPASEGRTFTKEERESYVRENGIDVG